MGHMTERAITACVFLISMCGAALAQPSQPAMPNWDPRAYCERSQRMIAMESATMLRACIDQEERAEAMLKRTWDVTPAPARRHCVRQQEMARFTSYTMLNACIEMERTSIEDLQRRPPR
jgi:hypothetical protein